MPMRRPQAQRTPQGTSPTATRPWAYLPHCHSPPGRADRAGRTATRALGVPPALPLAPWARRPRQSHCHSAPSAPSHTATRPWAYLPHCHSPLGVPPRTFTAEWQCEPHFHSALGVPSALPLAPWARRFGAFDTEWQCETHCHSPPGRADRANRTATRPPAHRVTLPLAPGRTSRTATRPWAFRPARSPPSGSVNHTSTRPWAYQAHCHSPLGRADSVRSIPSGSVRRTATRPLGAPTALIALPLAPERTVRTAKRPEPLSYRPWVRFWQAIDVFRVIPRSHHAMGPIESALVSLAAGTPGKGLGDPSSFESIHP